MTFASSTCQNIDASTTNCDYYLAWDPASTTNGFTHGEIINSVFLIMIFLILSTILFFKITFKNGF